MEVGKPQGVVAIIVGLLLLMGAILVFINVPSWGEWLAAYPQQLAKAPIPPQAAPMAAVMGGVFGPLLQHVGGYLQDVGYFVGSLLTLVSLVPIGMGIMLLRGQRTRKLESAA